MGVTVYGVIGSPYLRGALLGLEERDVPYRLAAIPMGAHLREPHLKRHPFGRVPVLEHDGFELYETQAILRYIASTFPGEPLEPADPRQAARMNQLMGINDWYLFHFIAMPINRPRFAGVRYGLPVDEAAIRAAIPQAKLCLKVMSDLMGDNPYLAGSAVTLADLLIAPHMAYFFMTPESKELTGEHPALRAWMARMNERPSMIRTVAEQLAQVA